METSVFLKFKNLDLGGFLDIHVNSCASFILSFEGRRTCNVVHFNFPVNLSDLQVVDISLTISSVLVAWHTGYYSPSKLILDVSSERCEMSWKRVQIEKLGSQETRYVRRTYEVPQMKINLELITPSFIAEINISMQQRTVPMDSHGSFIQGSKNYNFN